MQEISPELKITCMSDTHGNVELLDPNLEGDIFIHAGDFTQYSKEEDFFGFLTYLSKLKFRYKVVICGNNERAFDEAHAKNIKVPQGEFRGLRSTRNACRSIVSIWKTPAQRLRGSECLAHQPRSSMGLWASLTTGKMEELYGRTFPT